MVVDEDLFESFQDLCRSPVSTSVEAESILSLLADIILNELNTFNKEDCKMYCHSFVNSLAFRLDTAASRNLIVNWLEGTDTMHTQWLFFLGNVLATDLHRCTTYLHAKRSSLNIITNVVWTYRHTQPGLVQTFLSILYEYVSHAQIGVDLLNECISKDFVAYLYWLVCAIKDDDNDGIEDELLQESLRVLVALNDQYMLHDLRRGDNKVFYLLEINPSKFVQIGGQLVLLFNRCSEYEQNLKIFLSKFFFLVFSSPQTMDLLYTNDLYVLGEVLVRELNDLALDDVDVRAMYLRLLYVMAKNTTLGQTNPKISSVVVQTLRMTVANASEIESVEDQLEIVRLAERCLTIEWLGWSSSNTNSDCETPETKASNVTSVEESPNAPTPGVSPEGGDYVDNAGVLTPNTPSPGIPTPRKRISRPPPPPPPPPRSRAPEARNNSSTSLESLKTVGHLRPPPPPSRKTGKS